MRVALITHGTRGDVQPITAVAAELRARGHDVVLGVPANLAPFAARMGFSVVPLTFDTAQILDTPRGHRALAGGNFYSLSRWIARLHHERSAELDADVDRACAGADLIMSNFMLEERAASVAERDQVPLVILHSLPLRPSRSLANAMVSIRSFRWGWLNLGTHALFTKVWWGRLRADTNVFRQAIGLEPVRATVSRRELGVERVEVQAYSPLLVPELAAEWAGMSDRHFTGFIGLGPAERALLEEESDGDELGAWLAAGQPPVYFGFGSMPMADPAAVVTMISQVCARIGVRGLIVSSQPGAHPVPGVDPLQIRVVAAANHDTVLPRVAAAVHHGGAGTLAATLRAGRPALICSFWADQPFWGTRVERLGAGIHHRFRDLDADVLERGVRRILEPEIGAQAAALGEKLRAEPDGALVVADLIEKLLSARG